MGRLFRQIRHSDFVYELKRDRIALSSFIVVIILVFSSLAAPLIAPSNPYDLTAINLVNSLLPPAWIEEGRAAFLLGSDDQGRDLFSSILYGMRISLIVGGIAVLLSIFLGVSVGLISGAVGGWLDSVLMRIADVQLAFPAILVALLIDGVARAILPVNNQEELAIPVLVFSIALSGWVQYARAVRAATMSEMKRDYVAAVQLIGSSRLKIWFKHVLPNVTGPVFVIATVHLATAIVTEATLSFLGVGMPPTVPSLGSLIRTGYNYLFSGEWWIAIFPGLALVLLVLAVNVLGDWLRDTLNPKLK